MNEEGRFLNPYNFIPFPEHRSEHYDDTDVHTGVITYTITARSPLFIPNTSSEHLHRKLLRGWIINPMISIPIQSWRRAEITRMFLKHR